MEFEKVSSLFRQQLVLLDKMLIEAQKQNQALCRNDPNALNNTTKKLEVLAWQMHHLEATCQEMHQELEQELHLPPATTLQELLTAIPEPVRAELEEMEKSLSDKAGRLARLVKLNKLLTQNALQFNARLLRAIVPAPEQTYLQNGTVKTGDSPVSYIDKSI